MALRRLLLSTVSRQRVSGVSPFGLVLAILLIVVPSQSQTFTSLHSFRAPSGTYPESSLVRDAAGNLYGTTSSGGPRGGGTVFRISALTGQVAVLYSFVHGGDQESPHSLLPDPDGGLYGTTLLGRNSGGSVFHLSRDGTLTILHAFGYSPQFRFLDGNVPIGLTRDPSGTLYGVALLGGAHAEGTLYKLAPDGAFTVLHDFGRREADGFHPNGGLVESSGYLYGTTSEGAALGAGMLFRYRLSTNVYDSLYVFGRPPDGMSPRGALTRDADGNLYGTTYRGGTFDRGVVYKIDIGGTETILHDFVGIPEGSHPEAGVVRDAEGNLYGTTKIGGDFNLGTVFKIDPTGVETVLHSFNNSDGAAPRAELLFSPDMATLYGTTYFGGSHDLGTVFSLVP